MPKKRKHRATGKKPPGGARAGAGRPNGSYNALPLGAVSTTVAFSHRAEGLTAERQAVADKAFQTYVDVMEGKVPRGALFRLMAAKNVREELCPPLPKRLEHTGKDGQSLTVRIDLSSAEQPRSESHGIPAPEGEAVPEGRSLEGEGPG